MSHHPERTARNVRPVNQPPSLQKVLAAKEQDFCREAEKFLQKYQHVKDDLKGKRDGIYANVTNLEMRLTGIADNYLVGHADKPDSEDYENRIARAKARIECVTNLLNKISAKSTYRGKYDDEKQKSEDLIANLNNDKPCYEAMAALREDNRNIVTGKVRRIHAFLQDYAMYSRCENFMAPFRCEYSNELSRIQSECFHNVTNNYVKNDQPTAEKIKRIKNQIAAYQIAYNEYVIGSDEFRDAEKSISQLKGMLDAAKKMNGCEMQLHRIEASSYNGRLKALDNFKNEYKEILTAEQNTTVTNLEEEALKYWQNYQSTNEWRYAIKEDDPLDVQKLNAGKLETVYSTLMGEVLPNSSYYTLLGQRKQELGDRKQSIERDQKLENAFHALPSTNAVQRCQLLNAIDVFELTYHGADYTSKHAKQVFDQLKQRKDEAERAFWSDYTNQIDTVQCPPETNFFARFQWADACKKISEESYKGLGSNNVIRLRLEAEHKGYEEQYRRFAQLYGLASRANEIVSKSPTNDVRVVCDRLSEIKNFYSTYPSEANQDPLVGGYYSKVKNAQEENEEVISHYLDKKLSEMDNEYPLYGATEKVKLEVWKKELDLLGEYIPKFVEGSNPHTDYKQRLADLNSQFSDTQRKDLFYKDDQKLHAEIKDDQDLGRKLQKIRGFLEKNSDVRSNDFAKGKIGAWERDAKRIEEEIKFDEYNGELEKVITNKPAEDADKNTFDEFTAQITLLKNKLGEFKQITHLKKKYQGADQKLQEQFDYIEKALGDGSWKAIQDREEEYKKDPCEKTEKKLRDALANFDEKRFGKYLERKKETETRFNRDIELRMKVLTAKNSFFENPSHQTFVVFKKAVETCLEWETGETPQGKAPQRGEPYGCQWSFVGNCSSYISKIENGIQVTLAVESVDFTGSWKTVEIRVADRPVCELFKVHDHHNFGVVTVGFSGLCFNVKYENTAAYREVSKTLSFWDILKKGATSGNCRPPLSFEVTEKMWLKDPTVYTGTLQLSIQGIPYMP